jgi:hypothetical protein
MLTFQQVHYTQAAIQARRSIAMIARMVSLLCVATLVLSASAQTATRPSTPTTAPAVASPVAVAPAAAASPAISPAGQSVGTVNGTEVYIRSAASMVAYPCAKVSKPASVTVVGKQGDWLEILPPSDTFSVVDKTMVQPDAGNQSGTIKQDTFARAGGALRSNDFTALQVKLKAGEKIKITGEIGDYYRIVPPAGAHLYISARYVDMPGAGSPIARTTLIKPADNASGSVLKSLDTETITKTSTTTSAPAINPESMDQVARFQAVEKKLQDAFKGPAEKINVQDLLADYQDLKITNKRLKDIADYRIKFLQNILDMRSRHLATEDLIAQEAKNQGDIDREIGKIITRTPADLPQQPTAQGVLVESALFQGGATGPKKYTLRDPVFQRIDAYVQCSSGAINLQDYVGKAIAVKGTTKFEPNLKLNVVEVQEVILLDDKFELPPTNKPTIIEPPAPPVKANQTFKSDAPKASEPATATKDAGAKVAKEDMIFEPIPPEELATKPALPAK